MTSWDDRFLTLAYAIAQWSKDPSTKVGSVIADREHRIVSHGYNGFPRGVVDCPERYADRALKYPRIVHAELNAILNASQPLQLRGSTLYATLAPCSECAKAIIQSGVSTVVCPEQIPERWADSMAITLSMFSESGVEVRWVSKTTEL